MAGNLYPKPSTLEEIEGTRLKFGLDGISGTRVAKIQGNQLFAALRFLHGASAFTASGTEIWYGADQWPGIPFLRCNSIQVEGFGAVDGVRPWDLGIAHTSYKLTIEYGVQKFEDSDDKDPEPIPFCTQSVDYGVEILSIPVKVGPGADPLAARKDVTTNVRLPTITYTLELPKVMKPKWSTYQSLCGKVNSTTVFGAPAETVLFDGPKANRTVALFGDKRWKVVMKFVYNPRGWNKSLNPDTLEWEDAVCKANGNKKRYETGNLRTLFT